MQEKDFRFPNQIITAAQMFSEPGFDQDTVQTNINAIIKACQEVRRRLGNQHASFPDVPICVFPELATSSYGLDRDILKAVTANYRCLPSLKQTAEDNNLIIVSGMPAEQWIKGKYQIINSAVIIPPLGVPIFYAKKELWGSEVDIFYSPPQSWQSGIFTLRLDNSSNWTNSLLISFAVCNDLWNQQLLRSYGNLMSQLCLAPSAGPVTQKSTPTHPWGALKALEATIFGGPPVVVYANKTGQETNFDFTGGTCVASEGEFIVPPMPADKPDHPGEIWLAAVKLVLRPYYTQKDKVTKVIAVNSLDWG